MGRLGHNLIGKQFGEWVVLRKSSSQPSNGGIKWSCVCSCGIVADVFAGNLRCANSTSCKSCAKIRRAHRFVDGSVFGDWTILHRADVNKLGTYRFLCKCACGTEQLVWGTSLGSGRSSKCKQCGNKSGSKKRTTHGFTVSQTKESRTLYNKFALYGVTPEEYQRVLEKQFYLCAICTASLKRVTPNLDHCHKTGRFRGILCGPCNRGVGHFSDSPSKLKRAVKYLNNGTDARQRE